MICLLYYFNNLCYLQHFNVRVVGLLPTLVQISRGARHLSSPLSMAVSMLVSERWVHVSLCFFVLPGGPSLGDGAEAANSVCIAASLKPPSCPCKVV